MSGRPWRGGRGVFKRQVPLIDRAARICQALGLELYLGPVRACKAVEDGVGRVRRPETRTRIAAQTRRPGTPAGAGQHGVRRPDEVADLPPSRRCSPRPSRPRREGCAATTMLWFRHVVPRRGIGGDLARIAAEGLPRHAPTRGGGPRCPVRGPARRGERTRGN